MLRSWWVRRLKSALVRVQIIYLVQTSQMLVKMKRTELRVKARRRAQAAADEQHDEAPLPSDAGGTTEDKKAR